MLPSLIYLNKKTEVHSARFIDSEAAADLNIAVLTGAMAQGDSFIMETSDKVLRRMPALCPEEARFRQQTVMDAIANGEAIEALYRAAKTGIDQYDAAYKNSQPVYNRFETSIVRLRSVTAMTMILFATMRKIGELLSTHQAAFRSVGMRQYIAAFWDFFDSQFLDDADA